MSAWIVSRAHIDVLVQGLAESERVTEIGPDELGRELWAECLASVAYRYPDDGDGERPGPVDFRDSDVETYTYRRPSVKISLEGLYAAIACYDYQSCEHPGYQGSRVYRWTNSLREELKLSGVDPNRALDVAPWGFDEEDVHQVVPA